MTFNIKKANTYATQLKNEVYVTRRFTFSNWKF